MKKRRETAGERLAEMERRMEENRREWADLKMQKKKLQAQIQREEEAEIIKALRKSGFSKEEVLKRVQGQ